MGIAILALLLASAYAHAQPAPYEMRQLAPGVHVVIRHIPSGGAVDPNVLIVINEADVVVVDANTLPSAARQVIAEIKKLTPLPVRYLINTHWHGDHHYGNRAYQEAYPGVEIIQHPQTRDLIVDDAAPGLAKSLAGEYPEMAARYRKALETGRRSNGEPVTKEQRQEFTVALNLYQAFIDEMTPTPLVPGTLTVADRLVLHRGARTIVVQFLGRGNTPGDLVVHLPRERIVATGDLVVHPIPFAFSCFPAEWARTLRELRKLDAATIVPGHGRIQSSWEYVEQLAALLESTSEQVQKAVEGGADLERTQSLVNLDRFHLAFGGEGAREEFDSLFRTPAVESAFRELRPLPQGSERR